MKKLIVAVVLLISIEVSANIIREYKIDIWSILDHVYDVEYNIC
jgi:hypothetical protein